MMPHKNSKIFKKQKGQIYLSCSNPHNTLIFGLLRICCRTACVFSDTEFHTLGPVHSIFLDCTSPESNIRLLIFV